MTEPHSSAPPQKECTPVIATAIKATLAPAAPLPADGLAAPADKPAAAGDKDKAASDKDKDARHSPLLLSLLAEAAGCAPADIFDFELNVCDVQPGVIGGAQNEFVFVGAHACFVYNC